MQEPLHTALSVSCTASACNAVLADVGGLMPVPQSYSWRTEPASSLHDGDQGVAAVRICLLLVCSQTTMVLSGRGR